MTAPRLALIGCGAIAERFHAPAIRRLPRLLPGLVLVDPNPDRARAVAAVCGGGRIAADHRELAGTIDGAIITAPHHLHHSIARALLEAGVHVLCEKPLAASAAEAHDLIATAERTGAQLAVNNTRRLYPSHRKVKELVADGTLGAPVRLTFEDGDKFDWPLASGALFGTRGGGHGVLLDIGAHVLDLVCWWLDGPPEVVRCEDDYMGGTEAMVEAHLRVRNCDATVRLSWLSKLRNGFVLEGERGRVEGGIYDWSTLTVTMAGRSRRLSLPGEASLYADFAFVMLDNLLAMIERGDRALVSGADVLPSIALIEGCYAKRQRLAMPWFDAYERVVP